MIGRLASFSCLGCGREKPDDGVLAPAKPGRYDQDSNLNPEAKYISAWRDPAEGGPLFGHVAGVNKKGQWANWGGNYQSKPAAVYAPRTRDELMQLVEMAYKDGKKIRAAGSGHSWAPLCEVDGGYLVLVKNMRSVKPGPGGLTVTVEPGALVEDLDRVFDKLGRSWASTTVEITFSCGGIIAPGCHGSGKDATLVSDFVVAVDLVTYDEMTGKAIVITIDKDSDPDLLRAAQVNMGCLGIVSSITFSTIPDFMVLNSDLVKPMSLLEDEAQIRALVEGHDYLDVNWFPFCEDVWVKAIDKLPEAQYKKTDTVEAVISASRDWFNLFSGRLAYDTLDKVPSLTPQVCKLGFSIIKKTVEERVNTVMPNRQALHYQAACDGMPCRDVEFAFPVPKDDFSSVVKAWGDMLALIEKYKQEGKYPVSLFGQLRFIKGSPADGPLLSTCIEKEGYYWCYIEVLSYHIAKHWDEFAVEISGLWKGLHPESVPHWAKEFPHTPEYFNHFRAVYGDRLEKFNGIRKQLDPKGMFSNKYIEDIFQGVAAPMTVHPGLPIKVNKASSGAVDAVLILEAPLPGMADK